MLKRVHTQAVIHCKSLAYSKGSGRWAGIRITWGFLKYKLRPHPQSLGHSRSQGICISNNIPDKTDATGTGSHLTLEYLDQLYDNKLGKQVKWIVLENPGLPKAAENKYVTQIFSQLYSHLKFQRSCHIQILVPSGSVREFFQLCKKKKKTKNKKATTTTLHNLF